MRLAPLSIAALLLAGCATTERPAAERPGADKPASVSQSINLSGYPPEFRKGFSEGCSAAKAKSAPARPKGESQYAAGWGDGYEYCKK